MFFEKYIKLIISIKTNYRWLPNDIRKELNDVLGYYNDLAIIAKVERS